MRYFILRSKEWVLGKTTQISSWLAAGIIAVFTVSLFMPAFPGQYKPVSANDSLWLHSNSLNVTKKGPYTLGTTTNNNCHSSVFKIQRYKWLNSNKWGDVYVEQRDVCAVQTPIGLVGEGYIQFTGTEFAQKVWNGGSDMNVVPVPGQKTVIVSYADTTSSIPHNKEVMIFYNILAAGESVIDGYGERKFKITSWPNELKDVLGKTLSIHNIRFSQNGEWALAVGGTAVIRIHIPTKTMQTIGMAYSGVGYVFDVSNDGRYAFVQATQSYYGSPYIFDLKNCTPSQSTSMNQEVATGCQRRSISSEVQAQIPGFRSLQFVKFNYDSQKITAAAWYQQTGDTTRPTGFESLEIANQGYEQPKVDYLALGDSFASGEGDTEGGIWYEPGTDMETDMCHVSRRSYPYLIAQQLGFYGPLGTTPEDDGQFHSVACSGAQSIHVLNTIQHDKVIGPPYWLQGTQVQKEWLKNKTPDSLTISMIGNDIGFGKKLLRCFMPDNCYETHEDRLEIAKLVERQFTTLVSAYAGFRTVSPNTRIYVLGYPLIVSEASSCGLNVRLNEKEIEFAVDLTRYINRVIKAATERAGVQYVDVEDVFANRELCSGHPQHMLAVNGITAGNDKALVIGNESYHPNQLGHVLYAARVMDITDSLTKSMPAPDLSVTVPNYNSAEFARLLGARKTGRALVELNYDDNFTNDVTFVSRRERIMLTLLPVAQYYTIFVRSEPVNLGTYASNADGVLDAYVDIPSNIPPGFHTISVTGPGPAGNTIKIEKIVYVAASETDFDGDGILNQDEKCGILEPLNQDIDQDGIDDACDTDTTTPLPVEEDPEDDPGTGGEDEDGDQTPEEEDNNVPTDEDQSEIVDDPTLCYKLQTCINESNPTVYGTQTITTTAAILPAVQGTGTTTARFSVTSVAAEDTAQSVQGVSVNRPATTSVNVNNTAGSELPTKSKNTNNNWWWAVAILGVGGFVTLGTSLLRRRT